MEQRSADQGAVPPRRPDHRRRRSCLACCISSIAASPSAARAARMTGACSRAPTASASPVDHRAGRGADDRLPARLHVRHGGIEGARARCLGGGAGPGDAAARLCRLRRERGRFRGRHARPAGATTCCTRSTRWSAGPLRARRLVDGRLADAAGRARPAAIGSPALVGIAAAPDFTDWGFTRGRQGAADRRRPDRGALRLFGDEPYLTTRAFWESGQANRLLDAPDRARLPGAAAPRPGRCRRAVGRSRCGSPRALRSADVQTILVKDGDHRLSRERRYRAADRHREPAAGGAVIRLSLAARARRHRRARSTPARASRPAPRWPRPIRPRRRPRPMRGASAAAGCPRGCAWASLMSRRSGSARPRSPSSRPRARRRSSATAAPPRLWVQAGNAALADGDAGKARGFLDRALALPVLSSPHARRGLSRSRPRAGGGRLSAMPRAPISTRR